MADDARKLAQEIADLKRRLEGLERGGQLARSSVIIDGQNTPVVPALATGITAASLAADAQRSADIANAQVTTAQQTADGKNTVTWSPNGPSGNGTAVGDMWMQRTADGTITNSWEWTGSIWSPRIYGDAVLGSLTAGKITTGTLNAGVRIVAGNPTGARIEMGGTGFYKVESDGSTSVAFPPGGGAIFSGTVTGSTIMSANYAESQSGYQFDSTGRAEVNRLQVNQQASIGDLQASKITVAGQPLNDLLNARPSGLIAQGFDNSQNLQNVTVSEQGIAELGFTADPGRGYIIQVNGPEYATSDASTIISFRARYTTDGTLPTINSTQVRNYGQEPGGFSAGRFFDKSFLWYPPISTRSTIRLLFSFGRVAGSGSVGINCTGDRRLQMYVYDIGPALPNGLRVNNSGASSPAPTQPAPVQSYTETFYITWGMSYLGNGNQRGTANIWQGQAPGNSGGNGNQRGLIGFDDAYIRSRLSGATIKSATLYGRAAHTYFNSGGTAYIGSHNYSSAPATFPFGNVNERRASVSVPDGGWFQCDVAGVMNEIRDGSSRGFAIGAAPNTDPGNYAYFYNYPSDDRFRVVCTWEK